MIQKGKPVPDCKQCEHRNKPADHPICTDCWNYQRGKNYVPAKRREDKL